ncbi:MAG: hypothetical protein LBT50_11860 [Prevotellaceae bacterium]|nr:hypothetical protein [Prevotellaceae bacterium]
MKNSISVVSEKIRLFAGLALVSGLDCGQRASLHVEVAKAISKTKPVARIVLLSKTLMPTNPASGLMKILSDDLKRLIMKEQRNDFIIKLKFLEQ